MARQTDTPPGAQDGASTDPTPAGADPATKRRGQRLRLAVENEKGAKRNPMNFIRPSLLRTQSTPTTEVGRERPLAQEPAERGNFILRELDKDKMPSTIRERYVQDGRHFYLPNGDRAFVDHGLRLSTRSENTAIMKDLVSIAAARNWGEVVVGGSKTFRREAWREAKLAGLEVVGYTPSRTEQALLIRLLAHQKEDMEQRARTPAAETIVDEKDHPRSAPAGKDRRRKEPDKSPLITGKLLNHGEDHYLHDSKREKSYYVAIRTRQGEREIWGVDLERAIRQSLTDVEIGDDVGLRSLERRDFIKKTHRFDEGGQRVPVEVAAHRNGWIVEQRRFFEDRAVLAKVFRDSSIKEAEATRKYPELRGSYLDLQAAALRFERSSKNREDLALFLKGVRDGMAASMERGEPLMPVRMREQAANRRTEPTLPDPERLLAR